MTAPALRNGRNAEAFDPAIATDHAGAQQRLRAFLARYPQSPHADAARAAL